MYVVRCLPLVVLAGCGRLGFESPADDDAPADTGLAPDARTLAVPGPALHVGFEPDAGHADVSGRDHVVQCVGGCPTSAPGRVGSAGRFDTTACLAVDDRADLRPTAFTIAVWIRLNAAQHATMFGRSYMSDVNFENSFELYATTTRWTVLVGGAVYEEPFQVGVWTHVAAVYDGSAYRAFINGAFKGGATVPVVFSDTDHVRIGCDRDYGTIVSWLDGDLDEVLLYDRALTEAEVAALAGD